MRRLYLTLLVAALTAPMPALGQVSVSGAPEMPPAPGIKARATPQTDPSQWFGKEDYPADALRAQAEGPVGFALAIDIDGRVASCTVLASSGSASLDQRTCTILTDRARFVAASRKNRKPSPDRWTGTVDWKISEEMRLKPLPVSCTDCGLPWATFSELLVGPEPRGDPARWLRRSDCPYSLRKTGCAVTVLLTVRRNGTVRYCEATESSGLPAWDRRACALIRIRARFRPQRESKEKWTSAHWEQSYTWTGESTK